MIRPRWQVRCIAREGKVLWTSRYLFRRSALQDAHRMASPFYDTLVEDLRGRHRPLIWPHTPPEELVRRLHEGG